MADFRPQTTIYLFKDTRVDALNQPYFTNEGAKMSWYFSHPSLSYTQYSYQREQRAYVRVNGKADQLREYDMMAWQNEANKWVLCNVLGVEFINPNCTEITFEVDYMQTYIENTQFRHCWVEREMQENDWDGNKPSWNNLQPEGLETGALIRSPLTTAMNSTKFEEFSAVVISKYDIDGNDTYTIESNQNYPSGLNKLVFDIPLNGTMLGLSAYLNQLTAKGVDVKNAIVGIFVCPRDYVNDGTWNRVITVSPTWNVIDGYTLNNAKCFSSEFVKFEISNRRGEEVELKPERFTETDNIILQMKSNFGWGSGGAILYPQSYEGWPQDYGVILFNDIQAPFLSDAFSSWYAQNSGSLSMEGIVNVLTNAAAGSVAGGSVGGPAGAAVGGAVGAFVGAEKSIQKIIARAKDPAAVGGQTSGNVLQLVTGNYGFSINWVWPSYANIKCIDEFFSLYGYRTNRLKVPNVNTRPLWNYVKTAGAVVTGPFTHTAKIAMQNQLDNGVTFWHVPAATIGDYSDLAGNRSS